MIEEINNNQISDILKESSSKQTQETTGTAGNQASDSLQVDSESLIEKATQPPQEDVDALQRAQQLLLSGQLDSPQNIRAAAETIIKLGM